MRTHPALFVALLALSGVGATCNKATPSAVGPKDQGVAVEAPTPDEPVVQAPQITEVEGVSADELPGAVRLDFWRIMNETFCYCGCPRTLAACLSNRESCSCVQCSERMTSFILDLYRSGASTEDVEFTLLEGFAEGYNGAQRSFEVDGHPSKGPVDAKYTLVEFADFRCGHCKAAKSILDKLVSSRDDVRLVYFYYPLGDSGSVSQLAAEAAEEAQAQGKFWQMSDLLFDNQHKLDETMIPKLAEQAGLDMTKFKAAMANHTHQDRVAADKAMGHKVEVESTPSIFVNGRRFGLPRTEEFLQFRLEIEAERGTCK